MKLRYAIRAALAAGVFVAAPAIAADDFTSLDKNNDGSIDATDAAASSSRGSAGVGATSAAVTFDSLDKNNDGNIDATEAAAEPWLQQGFATYDTDHDGKLGKDEFAAAQKSRP